MQSTFPFIFEIELNFKSMMGISGTKNTTSRIPNRQSRRLMNVVGRLANVLFGVCSDQDVEFFYSNIKHLSRSGDKITHLMHEQVRIVSSIVNNVHSTMNDQKDASQKIHENIKELETDTHGSSRY